MRGLTPATGFLLMMGVLDDYTVSGSDAGTIYNLTVNPIIRDYLADRETHREAYRAHLIDHLHKYLLRYRPMSRAQLVDKINQAYPQGSPSKRILGFLIDFIHGEIGKQRKEAVRTMLRFCTQPDTSPEQLRATIKAYFDRNPKFSDKLYAGNLGPYLEALKNAPHPTERIASGGADLIAKELMLATGRC